MKLSIIVPCYNEEQTLQNFFDAINAQMCSNTIDYEIIFINDGSKDNSLNIMKQLATDYTYVRYISFSRNFGKEAAMYAGLENFIGDYVVIMDADLQNDPRIILDMINL